MSFDGGTLGEGGGDSEKNSDLPMERQVQKKKQGKFKADGPAR